MLQGVANDINIDKGKRDCTSFNFDSMRITGDMNMEIMGNNANVSLCKSKVEELLRSGLRQVHGKLMQE